MSSEIWGAAAVASGMWLIACVALIAGNTKLPTNGALWTLASSERVASHPTLVRRAFPGTVTVASKAELTQAAFSSP
jgi:hypothetical protein